LGGCSPRAIALVYTGMIVATMMPR